MERQRSFSFKPTRLLVFSFTIFSYIIFLSTFTIWITGSTPSVHQHTHLHFNASSSIDDSLTLQPLTVQSLTGFTKSYTVTAVKIPTFIPNHLATPENSSGSKSDAPEDGGRKADASSASFKATLQESVVYGTSPWRSVSKEQKNVTAGLVGKAEVPVRQKNEQKTVKGCDLTKGNWVFDESYPLYTKDSCPYIDEGFNCEGNGRLDRNYSKWRWQPKGCDLPSFNATKMLELIRGKRLVFVGDSINRNQFESMLCMLMGAIRDQKRVYETHGRRITKEKGDYSFRFLVILQKLTLFLTFSNVYGWNWNVRYLHPTSQDYQCTVEYYVPHFLVHESKARIGQKRRPTLRIDAIDHGSSRWRGADILVFNTAHWWSHYKTKAGINYYQVGSLVYPQLNVTIAFRKALMTWASWVDKRINPGKTQVYFRSSAPSHFRGGQWNSGGHRREATHPLNETFTAPNPEKSIIAEEVIKQMKTPVKLLNITSLSEYRIDGHPSIYGRKTQSSRIQDCSHWCLPGVPDTWNELLYFHLLR